MRWQYTAGNTSVFVYIVAHILYKNLSWLLCSKSCNHITHTCTRPMQLYLIVCVTLSVIVTNSARSMPCKDLICPPTDYTCTGICMLHASSNLHVHLPLMLAWCATWKNASIFHYRFCCSRTEELSFKQRGIFATKIKSKKRHERLVRVSILWWIL